MCETVLTQQHGGLAVTHPPTETMRQHARQSRETLRTRSGRNTLRNQLFWFIDFNITSQTLCGCTSTACFLSTFWMNASHCLILLPARDSSHLLHMILLRSKQKLSGLHIMAACVAGGRKTVAQVGPDKRINPNAPALRRVLRLQLLCKNLEAEEIFDGTDGESNRSPVKATNACAVVHFTSRLKLGLSVQMRDTASHEVGWTSRQPADAPGAR